MAGISCAADRLQHKGTDAHASRLMNIEWYVAERFRVRFPAIATAALLPVVALGQGADELASMIEQSLQGIEFRIDIRPEQAATDLEAQRRQLQLLEQQ